MTNLPRLLCSLRSLFRKWAPALIFVLTGCALVLGRERLYDFTTFLYQATGATGGNMKAAEVAADSMASGWLPFGNLSSKELAVVFTFALLCIMVWRMQRLVLPGPARWARKDYSQAFDRLPDADKFRVYQQGRWQLIALAGVAAVFAGMCL